MDEHDAARQRAEMLLEAHSKTYGRENHDDDDPYMAIQRLLADLMHYCHDRNNARSSGEYLEFDHMIANARVQCAKEREGLHEIDETRLDPDSPFHEPGFKVFLESLERRQGEKRSALQDKHMEEWDREGMSKPLNDRHLREVQNQEKQFKEEREGLLRESREEKRIARQIREQDPKLALLLKNLEERQEKERVDLIGDLESQIKRHGGDLSERFYRKEIEEQKLSFIVERERYISDYKRANAIKAEMEKTHSDSLEKGLDPDNPKRTR